MKDLSGKNIKLYLVDGTPQGLMTLEVINWTGHVLVAPRTKIAELIKRKEMDRTGLYFLSDTALGRNTEKPVVYIGQSDKAGTRLMQHEDKQFWDRVCVITSKDQNLTTAHVKYLESRLISIVSTAGIAKLANDKKPVFDRLPEGDKADMEYFISQIKLVMPILGLDILRDKPQVSKGAPTFEIEVKKHDIKAKAKEVGADFILLAGSETQPRWVGITDDGYRKKLEALISDKKIIVDTALNKGIVQEDIPFTSPSAAAAVVLGRSSNGRVEWKLLGDSKTYQDWQGEQVAKALVEKGAVSG